MTVSYIAQQITGKKSRLTCCKKVVHSSKKNRSRGQTDKHRQSGEQAGRKTDRQTQTQTDRHRQTDTLIHFRICDED